MKKNTILLIACALFGITIQSTAWSYSPDYNLNFSPYVGGGRQSNHAKVRHSSGIRMTLDRRFTLDPIGLRVGPAIEVGNGFVNSHRTGASGNRTISTYDNRFFLGGFHIGKLYGDDKLSNEVFFKALTGFTQTKLSEDESGENTFIQKDFRKIRGKYYSAEMGTSVQLQKNFSMNFSILGQLCDLNQTTAAGSVEGESADSTGKTFGLSAEEQTAHREDLDNRLIQRSIAASAGVIFGF